MTDPVRTTVPSGLWFRDLGDVEADVVHANSERVAMLSKSGHATQVVELTADECDHPGDFPDHIPAQLGNLVESLKMQVGVDFDEELLSDLVEPGTHPPRLLFDRYKPKPVLVRVDEDALMPFEWDFGTYGAFMTIYRNHWVSALYPATPAKAGGGFFSIPWS